MKRALALATVLLVVLAGCSGPGGGGTTTAPQAGPGPDATPTQTTDPTRTTTAPGDGEQTHPVPGVSDGEVNESALIRAHVQQLLDRNHTFRVSQQFDANRTRLLVARSADDQAIVTFNSTQGVNYTSVFTGEDVYQQRVVNGESTLRRPNADPGDPPAMRTYLAQVFGDAVFHPNGTAQANGERLYRLSAGPEDLTANYTADPVAFQAELLVTESGLIRFASYDVVLSDDGQRRTLGTQISVANVGSTQIVAPRWLNEAVETLGDRPSGPPRRTVVAEDLGATLTVTGDERARRSVSLSRAPAAVADREAVQAARASPVVSASANGSVDNATITLDYDERAVPDGDERGLWVFVYNATYDEYLQMQTTIDPGNDTVQAARIHPQVTVTVDGEEIDPELSGLPDGTAFVVMHAETYFRQR